MFTIGTDPEFFLIYKNQPISAIGILPEKTKNNTFYFDNVLAEIAVKPANNKEEFIENITNSIQKLEKIVYPAKLLFQASINYPNEELKHKKANEAGCIAEYSAYSLDRIIPPKKYIIENKHITNFRTAGGHIHLGHPILQNGLNAIYMVKMMDLFISIPEILFNKDKTAKKRRKVYGVAGSHRITDYGIEYRPLSNYWLSNPIYIGLIYDLCNFALDFVEKKEYLKFWNINKNILDINPQKAHECFGYDVNLLKKTINKYNKDKDLILFIENYLPNCLKKEIYHAS